MKIVVDDSRRLTGPNLFWDLPGAILDVAIDGVSADRVVQAWSEEVGRLMSAVGWSAERICSRQYEGGASLVINAPIDVLYAACELNEAALSVAIARLNGEQVPDEQQTLASLKKEIDQERKPALLALQDAAASHQVPFLWDDDEVSVGFGKTALTWPADQLPSVDSIDWSQLKSIPLGIVTGTNGKSTTVRLAASILAAAGLRGGITSTDYIRVGDEILDHGDYSGPGGARTLLRHPKSEAVVLEVARGGLLRRGIGVEHADAALVTNIAADHLGEYGINSVEDMAEAKFIVRRALGAGAPLILNADDVESVRLAASIDKNIIWFGLDAANPILKTHLDNNGTAAYLQDGWLVLARGGEQQKVVAAKDIPITFGGIARYNISNALGALLLCHVLGVAEEDLASGLKAFSGDADVNPGRGNLFEKNGIRIFVDFAHNEHGLKAVGETIRAFGAKRHIILMGQAGDRSDKDIGDFVQAACRMNPDQLLVCQLPGYERGRDLADVPKLICEIARREGVPEDAIISLASPLDGVRKALSGARPGDCLVLLALSQRDQVLEVIKSFVADG